MTVEPITTRDYEARTGSPERTHLQLSKSEHKETSEMLLHEELSRARIRDLREGASARQSLGGARAHRRWNRLARWAARRAERHQEY
jgi:hypothetical protein